MTFDEINKAAEMYHKVLDKALDFWPAFVETQQHQPYYHELLDTVELSYRYFKPASYDSEDVYFVHTHEEEPYKMPLAFVYSKAFRDRLVKECQEKLAEKDDEIAKAKAYKQSPAYLVKVQQFRDLAAELGVEVPKRI